MALHLTNLCKYGMVMDNEDIANFLQNWLNQGSAARDCPFEWKGELSFFELTTSMIDAAILGNQPISVEKGISHAIARRRHEHNISYFQHHHPLGCDELELLKACQTLDISPDCARFCAAIAVARTRNSLKSRNGENSSYA